MLSPSLREILREKEKLPSAATTSRAKLSLDLVHSYVVSVTPTSKGRPNFFVTFIDDRTRYTLVYPMKRKAEITRKIYSNGMVENFHGLSIRTPRSDSCREYVGKDFVLYLQKYGI